MGQIMFLHFIQKKGWLGVTSEWGDGDKSYLLKYVQKTSQGTTSITFQNHYFITP